ncbi:hypothetical protein ACXC9Q_25835 (plasmid) [Kribbella sp. CWNU-51]
MLTVGLIALAIVALPMLLLVFAVLVVAVRSQKLDAAGRKHSLQLVAEMTRLASVLVPRRREEATAQERSVTGPDRRLAQALVTAAEVTPIPLRGGVDP